MRKSLTKTPRRTKPYKPGEMIEFLTRSGEKVIGEVWDLAPTCPWSPVRSTYAEPYWVWLSPTDIRFVARNRGEDWFYERKVYV